MTWRELKHLNNKFSSHQVFLPLFYQKNYWPYNMKTAYEIMSSFIVKYILQKGKKNK